MELYISFCLWEIPMISVLSDSITEWENSKNAPFIDKHTICIYIRN